MPKPTSVAPHALIWGPNSEKNIFETEIVVLDLGGSD